MPDRPPRPTPIARTARSGAGGASDTGPQASAGEADVPDDAHDCLIEPHTFANVGSPVQGIVARLLVDRGETVARGQPIVELESAIERATLEQAEARADMRSEVASREADLALARLDERRFADLHARSLAPEQQHDEASARYRVANAALVQALENRKLLYLELQRADRQLAQRTVRSPVDGVVVRQLLFPGELVHDDPVMTIAELDPLHVEVVLPARLFGTLAPGDTARLFLELETGGPLTATVEVVDPLLDARSGTFGVRLRLPNPEHAVVAGQNCRVAFDEPAAGDGAEADVHADAATEERGGAVHAAEGVTGIVAGKGPLPAAANPADASTPEGPTTTSDSVREALGRATR